MDRQTPVTTKQWLFVVITTMMLSGLFVSRGLLSISSFLMLLVYFSNPKKTSTIKHIVAGAGLILLPVIVSGLWSSDERSWWRAVEVKLPLLAIGLGVAASPITLRQWRWLSRILILFTTFGTYWSAWQYFQNSAVIIGDYLRAKVMDTPLDNDHIRFSWLVVLCIILSYHLIKGCSSKLLKTTTLLNVAWLIIYLHLLSAKTGLVCLYAAGLIFTAHYIFTKKRWLFGGAVLLMMIAIPFIAYNTLPTFKNRLQYIQYDFSNYSKGNFIPGSSDAARVLSIRAGWKIMSQNPGTGVGFGDMLPAIDQWHQQYQPNSLPIERFLPLNQWLLYGTGSGVPGVIFFTAGILFLFSLLWRKGNLPDRIALVVLLLPLVTDDTLESQFGVFIFIFILVWLWLHRSLNQPAVA